jgi:hypothetical protein
MIGAKCHNSRTDPFTGQATINDISGDALRADPFFQSFSDVNLINLASGSAEAANVQVRADVLGRGIPALSLATGANSIGVFDNNFDMNSTDPDTGFQTGWPQKRLDNAKLRSRWLHSDLKAVAYPFNHKLHDKFVQLGGLNNDN